MNYNIDTDVNESDFEDLRELEQITSKQQIYDLLGDTIILNRYIKEFDMLYNRIVDVCSLCWNNYDEDGVKLQSTMMKLKLDLDDHETHILPLNRLMVSLVFIKPILRDISNINIEDFILHEALTVKRREQIQDNIVKVLMSNGCGIKDIQVIISRMALDLKELLLVFSYADMQVFTAENLFLDYYRKSEIVRDINNTEYGTDVQTSDIIEENKRKYKLLEAEMLRLGNPFFLDNKYTSIIKPKQMEELYINFSQIPDGKNIVPVIMNGNGFKAGYHDPDVLYAGAIAARVPDMMNEEYMGSAGYFSRNLMILTYGSLSKTVYDCGSVNYLEIPIVDKSDLEMFDGRHYTTNKDVGVLKVLKSTDEHLIGETLYFRSPCTCNLNEDVCHVCYGTKALKVSNLKGGFIYTTELITNKVQKNILKAKHILQANAEKIEFSENFDKFFMIDNSTMIPLDDKKFDIYLPDNYQDNISNELIVYIGKDLIPVTIGHYANIHIPEKIIDAMKAVNIDDVTYHKITSFKVLELDGIFCNITPINIMMTKRYMDIMNLFESDVSKFESVEDAVIRLKNLMYGVMPVLSTHGELIISKLLRDVDNKLLRPNFLQPDVPNQILRLKTALQNIESVTTALAFEQTRHHLYDSIFDQRNEIKRVGPHSFTDYLFGEEII